MTRLTIKQSLFLQDLNFVRMSSPNKRHSERDCGIYHFDTIHTTISEWLVDKYQRMENY